MNQVMGQCKWLMEQTGSTCVIIQEHTCYTSQQRGVQPLLQWLEEGRNFSGATAADRVVGKGAALLYALLQVQRIYTPLISESALEVLRQQQIEVVYEERVPHIFNRSRTGYCPIETAVAYLNEPQAALPVIRQRFQELTATGKGVSSMEKAKVYFSREISPDSLLRLYQQLGRTLPGKIGVKISTGEPGGHYFLQPKLIEKLIQHCNGTIVECCTAYQGKRMNPQDHWQAIAEHGFQAIAPCDIMDEFADKAIPVTQGWHLKENRIGTHFDNYDAFLVLSHFKGHMMGGFGGALKNMSIGFASTNGKANIHTAGFTSDVAKLWSNLPPQDAFLESMADACKGVLDYKGAENFVYLNVANNLSVDCDCDAHPHAPEMGDIGVFASLDPVAIDQACYDAVVHAADAGKAALIHRMDSRHGIHTVEAACALGLGSRDYELIEV